MSIVKCPVCGNVLVRSQNAYVCERNHSFDIAAKGYVNLLPSNRKNSKQPGDNKQMIHSRNIFLNAGFYAKLSETINTLVLQHLSGKQVGREAHILDSGCGEGYWPHWQKHLPAGKFTLPFMALTSRRRLCALQPGEAEIFSLPWPVPLIYR